MAESEKVSEALRSPFTYGTATSPLESEKPRNLNNYDKDMFMKLLIAQMQYQDPLNPVDDKQFIAQMAQFTSLEQMQNLNAAYSKSQAYEMIGREVRGTQYIEESGVYREVMGIVVGVKTVNGEPSLVIQEEGAKELVDLALKGVEDVSEDTVRLNLLQNINKNIYNSENLALVGQNVQALVKDENGKPIDYVEGEVDSIRFGSNGTKLFIGGREITPEDIMSIGEGNSLIGSDKKISCYLDGEWVEGTIDDIKISGGYSYAIVNGKEVPFDDFNQLSDGFNMIGKVVATIDETSTVTGIGLKSGEVFVFLENGKELSVTDVRVMV